MATQVQITSTDRLEATLANVEKSIAAHREAYLSGQSNTAQALSMLQKRVAQKVAILLELRARAS